GSSANAGFQTMIAWRDRSRTLERFAGMRSWTPTLVVNGDAERIQAVRVSWNYFDLLGVRPLLGRTFSSTDDDGPHDWPAFAILSESLWRRRVAGGSPPVGGTVPFSGPAYRIVRVMPASVQPPESARVHNTPPGLLRHLGTPRI